MCVCVCNVLSELSSSRRTYSHTHTHKQVVLDALETWANRHKIKYIRIDGMYVSVCMSYLYVKFIHASTSPSLHLHTLSHTQAQPPPKNGTAS